ncbi:MAG TPA: RNA methyltransferase [Acidimicrobiales bacterium]|nr:RNA methyltransferase [Acidimicrobiales bacterium]
MEGAELLSVAMEAGAAVESVYIAPEGRSNPAVADVVARAYEGGARIFDLAPGVIERVADTVTPQPVLAVIGFQPADLEAVAATSLMLLVCADVRDPGNAGTVIRTADASGVDAVVCCDGTVDPTNPKTVRASAGSVFHTPIVMGGDTLEVVADLHRRGFTTVGTVVRGGTDYTGFDWRQRVAIVLGNEASGLSEAITGALDARVSIPMAGQAESLNVSASAAVLCFEALRQRRTGTVEPGSTMPEVESSLTDPSDSNPEPGTPRP